MLVTGDVSDLALKALNKLMCVFLNSFLQDKIELFVNRLDSVESVLPYEYTA